MPKYHFNMRSGEQVLDDDLGIEFPDNGMAVKAARDMVGGLYAEAMSERGAKWFGWTVEVVRGDQKPVASLTVPDEPAI